MFVLYNELQPGDLLRINWGSYANYGQLAMIVEVKVLQQSFVDQQMLSIEYLNLSQGKTDKLVHPLNRLEASFFELVQNIPT